MDEEDFDPAPYIRAGHTWVRIAGTSKAEIEQAFLRGVCEELGLRRPLVVHRQRMRDRIALLLLIIVIIVLVVHGR